jgi:fibronectin type 3 domain-containing protein
VNVKGLLVSLVFLLSLVSNGAADTQISGIIDSDTIWTTSGSPYVVTGNVLVMEGVTLIVEPGVIVKFDRGKALQVNGKLIARGTSGNDISFTSNQSSPSPGDWGYIYFTDSSIDATYDRNGDYTGGSILEYCIIEYAGGVTVDYNGAVRLNEAHPFINHCTIRNNSSSGISAYPLSGSLKITNSTISNNTGGPINGGAINAWYGRVIISNNTIQNNSISGGGAGIMLAYCSTGTDISKNIIRNNKTTSGGGGGISIFSTTATITNNIIINNSAGMFGGGIIFQGTGTISNNIIFGNVAKYKPYGSGGVYAGSGDITITNNSIIGNTAPTASAVSYRYTGGNQKFQYNAIVDNNATGSYTVFIENSHPQFNYNNVFNNISTFELRNENNSISSNVNAKNNWWGTTTESEIQKKIYDWYDNVTKGFVDYIPWLTTHDTNAPISPPVGLVAIIVGRDYVDLSWSSNPESDTAGYKVYWDTNPGYPYTNVVDVGNVTSYRLTNLDLGVAYHIAITAYDKDYDPANDDLGSIVNENQTNGNESWYSEEIEVIGDSTPPSGTISINDGAETTISTTVTLILSATDEGSGMGEGAQMKFSNDNQTWSDPEPYSTTKENWDLTAYGGSADEGTKTVYALFSDAAGNWMTKAVSDTIEYISETDTAPPSSTITVPEDGATVSGKVYTIKGTATDDKSGVALVEVSTDGGNTWTKAKGTTKWRYKWTLPADGTYNLKSRATDKKGNAETPGDGITVIVDNEGISTPTGLTAKAGAKSIKLSWDPNKESDLAGYNLYRDTDPQGNFSNRINQELINNTSYTDQDVTQGETYWYKITAVDTAGNESNKSSAVSATAGAIVVWMPDIKGEAGDTVSLPINASNATGVGSTAAGIDIKLLYNPDLLTPTEVHKTSLTQDFTFYDNISQANGQLNISGISSTGATITGEGHIVEVDFSVNSSAEEGTQDTLSFVEVKIYDDVPSPLTVDYTDTATFTVSARYKRGDLNGDGAVDSADALIAMKIAIGDIDPSGEQSEAGDINGDGKIDTADAILILRMAVGLPIYSSSSISSKAIEALMQYTSSKVINVSIGNHSGEAGSTVTVPLIIDNLTGVAGADILLTYDPDILTAIGVSTTSLSSGFNLQYSISTGAIALSILSTAELSGGSGAFVNINFQINQGAQEGASTSLTLAQVNLYGQYGQNLSWDHTINLTNGEFTVVEFAPNTPGGLKATAEDKTVYIQWNANSEADIDHYNLYVGYSSKNYNMEGSPFNVGKVTSLTATGVPEGTYYLALSAVNSAGKESSLSEEIKVVVSTKPIITIASNQSSYSPGDTFSLSLSINNPTSDTKTVDVFVGIIAPDGSIFFFDSSLNNLVPANINDSKTFTPASTSLALSPGYDLPLTSFFSAILPSGLAEGTYQAFAALAEPGSVLAGLPKIIANISFSSFIYSR